MFVGCFFPQQAIFKLVPKDEVAQLPDDENTADKRADKLWKFFDKGENGKTSMKVNKDNNGIYETALSLLDDYNQIKAPTGG